MELSTHSMVNYLIYFIKTIVKSAKLGKPLLHISKQCKRHMKTDYYEISL